MWIVLYRRGQRWASFPKTAQMLADIHAALLVSEIQTDSNGTVHFEIYGARRKGRK